MKQGRPLITFVIALFAGALVLYAIFSVWKTFQDPFVSTYVYSYTLNDSIQTDGLIIRQEQVLSGGQGIVDVTRGEGEQVGLGQQIGLVYRDDQAQQAQEQQEALRLEITQLQYALGQGEDVSSAAKLNDDILNAMVSLRVASTQQDFSDLEDQVLEVKGKVLRREYTYSDELSTDSLATRLQELQTQYQTLINQSYSAITQVTATVSGTFSTLVDGYEGLINLESAMNLTPQALTDLMNQTPTGDSTAVGKLISSNRWYFAAVVTQEEGERLEQAGKLTLRFAGDFTKEVSMTVEKVNQDDQGQAVVILSSDRYLEQTTLLRRETVEVMAERFCREQPAPAEWQKETEREIFRLGAVADNDPTSLVGSPVLFGSSFFSELLTLPENKGGNVLLKKYPAQVRTVSIAAPMELLDADTPQVLQQLEALARLKN